MRHTWWDSLRTQTCVPFMQSASPSCPRTSSWPEESVANVLKQPAVLFFNFFGREGGPGLVLTLSYMLVIDLSLIL